MSGKRGPLSDEERAFVERKFQQILDESLGEMLGQFILSSGDIHDVSKRLKLRGSIKFVSDTDMRLEVDAKIDPSVWLEARDGIQEDMRTN